MRIEGYGGGVLSQAHWDHERILSGLIGLLTPITYETWWAKLLRRFGMLEIIEGREKDLATMLERGFITDREERILTAMVHQRLEKPWMAKTGRGHAIELNHAIRWTVFSMANPHYSLTKLAALADVSTPTFSAIVKRLRPVLIKIAGEVGKTAELTDEHCSDSRSRHRYNPDAPGRRTRGTTKNDYAKLQSAELIQPEAA